MWWRSSWRIDPVERGRLDVGQGGLEGIGPERASGRVHHAARVGPQGQPDQHPGDVAIEPLGRGRGGRVAESPQPDRPVLGHDHRGRR